MKAVLIDKGDVKFIDGDFNRLSELQEIVGGMIEMLPFSPPASGAHCYINEEGKLIGLPLNELATLLMRDIISYDDFIVGPMVVLGSDDFGGEDDVPNDAVQYIQQVLGPVS